MNEYTLLLRNVFLKTRIGITPDRTALSVYTLNDIGLFREELKRLVSLAPDARNLLAFLGVVERKCEADVYRYDKSEKTILHSCPYALHPERGCWEFTKKMKPDVLAAYVAAVNEILYGGQG